MKYYKNLEEYKLKNPDKVKNGVITISENICLDLYLGKEIRGQHINMPKETQNKWEEEFEKEFPRFKGIGAPYPMFEDTPVYTHILSFISQEIEKSYQKGKEEILKTIQTVCNRTDKEQETQLLQVERNTRLKTLEEVEKMIENELLVLEKIIQLLKGDGSTSASDKIEQMTHFLQTINKMKTK